MHRILFIHIRHPEFDRSAGDLRVMNLLRLLAQKHHVSLHVLYQPPAYLQAAESEKYRAALMQHDIEILSGNLRGTLRSGAFDAVIVEYWFIAQHLFDDIRTLQPRARIVVDTEHLYFYSDRLRAKAQGRDPNDAALQEKKQRELLTYSRADSIITTTDEDKRIVLNEIPGLRAFSIPVIHDLPPLERLARAARTPDSLVFVGNFAGNAANVDGIIHFCEEVLPIIRARSPTVHLSIVGNGPPPELLALRSDHVTVTGYVPDLAPYLLSARVSICPLRFGAGLKGKIGESMMHGLPVVATSVGTQGMDAVPGKDIMVADSPQDFADAVLRLFEDQALWADLSANGYAFVDRRYSMQGVKAQVDAMIEGILGVDVRRYSVFRRWAIRLALEAADAAERHLLWRLRRAQ